MGGPVGGAGAVGAGIGSRKLATAATLLVMLAFVLYSCVCGPSACYSTIVSKNGEREGEVLHSANGGAAAPVPAYVSRSRRGWGGDREETQRLQPRDAASQLARHAHCLAHRAMKRQYAGQRRRGFT